MCSCCLARPTWAQLTRLALALSIVVFTLTSAAPHVAAWQAAPPSLPLPPPPPADPPEGFTSAETERSRIHVEPGGEIDADAFARSWGLLIDDGIDQLQSFLPPLDDKIDVHDTCGHVGPFAFVSMTPPNRIRRPTSTGQFRPKVRLRK